MVADERIGVAVGGVRFGHVGGADATASVSVRTSIERVRLRVSGRARVGPERNGACTKNP